MTPEQLCKSGLEHGEQMALFAWIAQYTYAQIPTNRPIDRLKLLFAIKNVEKSGSAKRGGDAKAEGVKAGVPDLFLPVATQNQLVHGLFIEMKRRVHRTHRNGGCSDEQLKWQAALRDQGYRVEICFGWEDARNVLLDYLK